MLKLKWNGDFEQVRHVWKHLKVRTAFVVVTVAALTQNHVSDVERIENSLNCLKLPSL